MPLFLTNEILFKLLKSMLHSHTIHGISMLLIFTAFSYTGIHVAFMEF